MRIPMEGVVAGQLAPTLDIEAGDVAAITTVLVSLHHKRRASVASPISVVQYPPDKTERVITTADVTAGQLELAPCTPKSSSRIFKTSSHPERVAVHAYTPAVAAVTAKRRSAQTSKTGNDDAAVAATNSDSDDVAVVTRTYYLHPEYRLPEDVTDMETEKANLGTRLWRWAGDESMYPFWAVERVAEGWIQRKNSTFAAQNDATRLAINLQLKEKECACVTVGELNSMAVGRTLNVRLPVLTNNVDLGKGTRLLMECVKKTVPDKRKVESWKTQVGGVAKVQKTQAEAKQKRSAIYDAAVAARTVLL